MDVNRWSCGGRLVEMGESLEIAVRKVHDILYVAEEARKARCGRMPTTTTGQCRARDATESESGCWNLYTTKGVR